MSSRSEEKKIERGVSKGRVFSRDLFNLYSKIILKDLLWEDNVDRRYTDYIVLIVDSEK